MSFDDLPALPRLIHPDGNRYVERIMRLGRLAQQKTPCVLDQSYGSDYWQRLDVYLPMTTSESRLPVFCFLPGGAWINGCKEWLAFMAPALTSVPSVFVALSYRHAPVAKFPAQLDVAGHKLRLTYRFVPGDPADGVTLHVPLALVNAVPAARCEWLVPGLLPEKVAELIRALPKAQRRNFVPAPDFARAAA